MNANAIVYVHNFKHDHPRNAVATILTQAMSECSVALFFFVYEFASWSDVFSSLSNDTFETTALDGRVLSSKIETSHRAVARMLRLLWMDACAGKARAAHVNRINAVTCKLNKTESNSSSLSRRSVLADSALLTVAAPMLSLCGTAPAHAALSFGSGKKELDYENVAKDITALMESDPDKGPTLVRLAWHSSGTYDKMTQTGGSGTGTIRYESKYQFNAWFTDA